MYYLVRKEFLVQKKMFLFAFLYSIFAAIVFEEMLPGGGALYMIAPYVTIYLLVLSACGYDDKNKVDIILNSLPVTRTEIVLAKYVSMVVFAIVGIGFAVIVGGIGIYTGFPRIERFISINDILVVLIGGLLFTAIFFPLYFKFGMEKMRIVNIVLFMLLFFVPNIITSYVAENPNSGVVKWSLSIINETPTTILKMGSLLAIMIIFLLSLFLSTKIYKNRDL